MSLRWDRYVGVTKGDTARRAKTAVSFTRAVMRHHDARYLANLQTRQEIRDPVVVFQAQMLMTLPLLPQCSFFGR